MKRGFGIAALMALALAGVGVASASESSGNFYGAYMRAMDRSCPGIYWAVQPMQLGVAAPIHGVAHYGDMSGVSTLVGTTAADGTVSATLNSVSGDGPMGAVTGKRTRDETVLTLKGPGCANGKFEMLMWAPLAGGGA